jgi:uracil-DNA glycosylase family 4
MQPRQLAVLEALGVDCYVPRARDIPGAAALPPPEGGHDWDALAEAVRGCRLCGLCETRTQTVFGVGNRAARLMVIGEAPGAEEDRQGEPFVGRAGLLLNAMLLAAGFGRGDVFIANVLKCLRYNALVQLEDGSWERIGRLVRSQYAGRVMSVDEGGRIVPRRVSGWYESPIGDRRVFRLGYRSARNAGVQRAGIELTGDHPVMTERGFIPVEELARGDRIATGQGLSPLAFDVACGSLLGDGHIGSCTSQLSFSHSVRQRDYALFKQDLLSELSPAAGEALSAAVSGGAKTYPVVHVFTRAHRALGILRQAFYSARKRVPPWMATRLNERMLAFWFMDDGNTRIRPGRQPLAEIATCAFDEHDLGVLARGLLRLGLRATIGRGRLNFDVTATRLLSERIAPYVPPAMRYKLHPAVAGRMAFDPGRFQREPAAVMFDEFEVEQVTVRQCDDETLFCIDVEETRNFVTAAGVVHNCRPPNNRDPSDTEAGRCLPYLRRQIELVAPAAILCVGRIAAQRLLGTEQPVGRLRGRVHDLDGVPVVVTYHPAYLLRAPGEKRKSWEDLKLALKVLGGGRDGHRA